MSYSGSVATDYLPRMPLPLQVSGPELYAVLIEKAFAKLAGSYANLKGGCAPSPP